ncbi:MAG: hypothetical protein ACREX5_11120 [Achromobacter pestifer]
MQIDWSVVGTVAQPVLAFALGILADRFFARRSRLVSFFGHVSTHRATNTEGEQYLVYTHEVVLGNVGRATANNVRLSHNRLPDFSIYPPIPYRVEELPGGVRDIVIEKVVPKQQVTVSYLYFPPLTAGQINCGIRSDEGFAKALNVLLQPKPPKLLLRFAQFLALVGAVAVVYGVVFALRWLANVG